MSSAEIRLLLGIKFLVILESFCFVGVLYIEQKSTIKPLLINMKTQNLDGVSLTEHIFQKNK
ncbi:hypothetical protein HR15_00085 [Porphyromonas gulae]|uniref:Uncharacterized protein n=1 Tax=Porphyromonas gulae TaxID=111105 RepID=A0A0A2FYP5_9PORP|nr:hypothetical protein HR15_00085 [Porphyromonas gulae]